MGNSQLNTTKRLVIITAVVVVLCGLLAGGYYFFVRGFSEKPDAIKRASASVVRLDCYDKQGELYCTGSAFAAFEDGVFVTNYHVIEQEIYRILAYTEDETMFEINTVLAADSEKDIAIIKTNANVKIAPLPLGKIEKLQKGEKVVAIGSPLGFVNTVSTGVYSGLIKDSKNDLLQFSAAISHGSSGGALFDNQGKVIGITSGSYVDGQNLNIAVPIYDVLSLREANSKEMSIQSFYETFNHYTEYTVDEVIAGLAEDCEYALIVGYVADQYNGECMIVADISLVNDYRIHRKKARVDDIYYHEIYDNISVDKAAEYAANRNKNVILLHDLSAHTDSAASFSKVISRFDNLSSGDLIVIKTNLKSNLTINGGQTELKVFAYDEITFGSK